MKASAIIFFGMVAALLCGCSQEKSQVGSMIWPGDATNCQLSVIVNHAVITTNVDSLEQAANILGQYGWQFTSAGTSGGDREFFMTRQYHSDDASSFTLLDSSWTQSP
ncbi:MAG TPA: hypothetical protein VMH87_00650 [Pseudomonadales bacterium]|nr:hypothetical protein [Pseudomonadales bacterium]